MQLKILVLSLILSRLIVAQKDADSSPKLDLEGLQNLVEKLESRLRDVETRMQEEKYILEFRLEEMEMTMKHKDGKQKEMQTKLEELEAERKKDKDELEKREGLEAPMSTVKKGLVEESSGYKISSNSSNRIALKKLSPRDLPIVFISA